MKKLSGFFILFLTAGYLQAQTEVTFYTNKGIFVAEIYDNIVPITGGNFLDLIDQKFYDGIIFHRVIDNFMIQGGDPTGTGSGGPGYSINDEFDPSLSNLQKTLSMANSGPNTGGSQFFINLVDNTYLDFNKAPLTSQHPVFGIVIMNFNIVQDIGKVAVNSQNRPLSDVVMDSVRRGNGLTVGYNIPLEFNPKITLYPNPADNQTVLSIISYNNSPVLLTVFDVSGKQVASQSVNIQAGINKILLSELIETNQIKGLYTIRLTSDNVSSYLKFIVK